MFNNISSFFPFKVCFAILFLRFVYLFDAILLVEKNDILENLIRYFPLLRTKHL